MIKAIGGLLLVVLLTSGMLVSCGGPLTGSGNLKTEEYAFDCFTSVAVSSAFEYDISQSDSYNVSITADDNVLEEVEVTKEGDTLKIGLRTNSSQESVTLRAEVTMPDLRGLVVSGASHGTVSGFSSMKNLDINVSGASTVTGDATAGDADFQISGASTIRLEGSAFNMVANVSGASHFNLDDFVVSNANVTFSGASNGEVNITGKLDADLSGESKLSYSGEPTIGTINISGESKLGEKFSMD